MELLPPPPTCLLKCATTAPVVQTINPPNQFQSATPTRTSLRNFSPSPSGPAGSERPLAAARRGTATRGVTTKGNRSRESGAGQRLFSRPGRRARWTRIAPSMTLAIIPTARTAAAAARSPCQLEDCICVCVYVPLEDHPSSAFPGIYASSRYCSVFKHTLCYF